MREAGKRILLAVALAAACFALAAPARAAGPEWPQRVEVDTPTVGSVEVLADAGFDLAAPSLPESELILWSRADRRLLTRLGVEARRIPDLRLPRTRSVPPLPSGRTTYRVWEDFEIAMRGLASRHPRLVRLRSMGRTRLGEPILGLEIAADVWNRDGRPAFVQYGAHHAREWPSAEWPMEYAIELIERRSEPRFAALLRDTRHFVFPVVNVDGFRASRGAGPSPIGADNSPAPLLAAGSNEYRRKTCRPLPGEAPGPCSTLDPEGGVDLNRNYGYYWGGTGTSDVPRSSQYRGPAPFSEFESLAVRDFTRKLQPTTLLTHHTYSEEGLWMRLPGFEDPAIFPGSVTPDEAELAALGNSLAEATGWVSQFSFELYPVAGATDDWNYLAQGSLALTSEGRGPDFHSFFDQMVRAEYPGIREAILRTAEASVVSGSQLTGEAPPGATLRIEKSFQIPTCSGYTGFEQCLSPLPTIPETLSSEMVVPESGEFSWRVNPSSRPLEAGEVWQLSCRPPGGAEVTREVSVDRGESVEVDLEGCTAGPPGPPTARIVGPGSPKAGMATTFRSASTDLDSLVVSNRWDLDGDRRYDDATGTVVSKRWKRAGSRAIGLRSVDIDGNVAVQRRRIAVGRRPGGRPSFSVRIVRDRRPAGQDVVFLASGPLGRYSWDLDGDGRFDDGHGRELSRQYVRSGSYRLAVRLVDGFGRVAVKRSRLTVG